MKKLGVILYGRATPELIDFVRENFQSQAELHICGALDGLTDDQVLAISASNAATGVPEYLSDERIVYVDHDVVAERVRALAAQFSEDGIPQSMICCTAPWPSLEAEPSIIVPVRILENVALSLLPTGGKLAVVQPLAETADEEIKHWQELGVSIIRSTLSAETCTDAELVSTVDSLVKQGADVIALDCLSFVAHHRDIVLATTGKPTLLPMSLVGKVIDDVLGV